MKKRNFYLFQLAVQIVDDAIVRRTGRIDIDNFSVFIEEHEAGNTVDLIFLA